MAQTAPSSAPATGLAHRKFHGCSSIREYEIMGKLGEGTFGEVHKARSRRTGTIFALKKILMHNEKDGFPITALREIKLLKLLCHPNVLKLEEMAVERTRGEGRKRAILYMVTPYMDHDLSGLLDNPDVRMTEPQIKCYMLQLLEGLRYLHDNHILHRDMKAANLLINNKGILQIADFGLARHYDEPVPKPGKGGGEAQRDYTALVVTRWYRPPELLLNLRRYTTAIDMWGAGCVFGEMFKRKPILAGNSDLNQTQIIFDLVGSPTEDNMPGWSQLPGCDGVKQFAPRRGNLPHVFREQGSLAISLLQELLKLDWRKRINAIDALQHPYFKEHPKPARPEDLPRFADSHELDRRTARGKQQALPPAPAGGTVGMGPHPNGDWPGGPPPHGGYMNGDRYPRDRGPPAYLMPAHQARAFLRRLLKVADTRCHTHPRTEPTSLVGLAHLDRRQTSTRTYQATPTVVGVAQTTETEMTAVLETGVDPHQEMTEEDIGTDVPVTMMRLITMKEDGVGRAAEALEAMLTIAAIATGIATGESEKGIFTGDEFPAGVVQTGISGLSESHDMALGQHVPTGVDDFIFFRSDA
ncbi:CMGC/CDK protein kinase [Lasiodiplodia theobromae]|uniref:CMGC/CDK protein kinase n=1 Tax=Lasiodiplodia theobromae TaxID=45133 RepID=UPI0015C38730|nr:CMGC/CDK protein kinase [Lasiodiplodia theobromae]KAF4545151.1 CMGC/CDK protein kinase [Lasiodiplodia theobromae]